MRESCASVCACDVAFVPAPYGRKTALVARNLLLGATMLAGLLPGVAAAETISGALARAYSSSPDLNQQRAATRSVDENIPKATAGFRPTVTATTDFGSQFNDARVPGRITKTHTDPGGYQLSIVQNLYNGNRTVNGIRQADSQVLQSRETLRTSEQNILNAAAVAYMNVLRDTAIQNLRQNNIQVLQQQLKQTTDRFRVGEVTRTDVAQSEAALAQGQSDAFVAQSNLQNSLAVYRQLIGVDAKSLEAARPLETIVPKSLAQATSLALREHPQVQAALHAADAAELAVKLAEGVLLPTVNLTGLINKRFEGNNTPNARALTSSIVASLSMPLYDGGTATTNVRQTKELFGQARLQADLARESVRATAVSAFNTWSNSRLIIEATQAAVRSNEIALAGIREEAKVGQRTTLDVLNAQQLLLNARVNLITAQRDRVVGSYALVSATGRLSAATLGLKVDRYDPTIHYDQVKDKWWGVGTPDGR
jgi:outer membrane protein